MQTALRIEAASFCLQKIKRKAWPERERNKKYYLIKTGSTGFDSEINWMVSTSSNDIDPRKTLDRTLNGENNYALAA